MTDRQTDGQTDGRTHGDPEGRHGDLCFPTLKEGDIIIIFGLARIIFLAKPGRISLYSEGINQSSCNTKICYHLQNFKCQRRLKILFG